MDHESALSKVGLRGQSDLGILLRDLGCQLADYDRSLDCRVVNPEVFFDCCRLRLFASYDLDVTLRPDVFNGHILNQPAASATQKFNGVGI
jgi:hypothetical protein